MHGPQSFDHFDRLSSSLAGNPSAPVRSHEIERIIQYVLSEALPYEQIHFSTSQTHTQADTPPPPPTIGPFSVEVLDESDEREVVMHAKWILQQSEGRRAGGGAPRGRIQRSTMREQQASYHGSIQDQTPRGSGARHVWDQGASWKIGVRNHLSLVSELL